MGETSRGPRWSRWVTAVSKQARTGQHAESSSATVSALQSSLLSAGEAPSVFPRGFRRLPAEPAKPFVRRDYAPPITDHAEGLVRTGFRRPPINPARYILSERFKEPASGDRR
jgi:hypothetical protein